MKARQARGAVGLSVASVEEVMTILRRKQEQPERRRDKTRQAPRWQHPRRYDACVVVVVGLQRRAVDCVECGSVGHGRGQLSCSRRCFVGELRRGEFKPRVMNGQDHDHMHCCFVRGGV